MASKPEGVFAVADQAGPASPVQMTLRQGLLSVNIRHFSLADLLRVIGKQAALRVTIHGALNNEVSDSFRDVPLDQAIMRLVRVTGLVLIHTASGEAPEAGVLSEVWVYELSPTERVQDRERVRDNAPKQTLPAAPQIDWASEAIADPDPSVRLKAVRVLAGRRGQAAAAILARVLAQDPDPRVRGQAADALFRIGGGEGAAAALSSALADQDPWVRIQTIRAFGKIEGDRATQALAEILRGDPEPEVRRAAAPAMAVLHTEEARWALQAATSDPNQLVSEEAAAALNRWETREEQLGANR